MSHLLLWRSRQMISRGGEQPTTRNRFSTDAQCAFPGYVLLMVQGSGRVVGKPDTTRFTAIGW